MRCLPLLCGVLASAICVTVAAQTPALPDESTPSARTRPPARTIFLNKLSLEELKRSNPSHYAKVERVLAQGSALCAPGAWQQARVLDLPPASCAGLLLRTSNPPKNEISFQLDDTRYVAYVTVRGAEPRMQRLESVEDTPRSVTTPHKPDAGQ